MKHRTLITLLLAIGAALAGLADANTLQAEQRARPAGMEAGADRQEIWTIERSGEEIHFLLREQDFGRDFAVFRTGEGLRGEWQLLRWVKRRGKVRLLTVSGRKEEVSPDWTKSAVVAVEFAATPDSAGVFRIDVTSLFGRAFPSGWGRAEGKLELAGGKFGAPKVFPRNAVISLTLAAGEGASAATWVRWNFVSLPGTKMVTRHLPDPSAFQPRGHWQSNYPRTLAPYEVALRWRLEGESSSGVLVEPDSPIVIHVDSATPARWQRWVAAGIESWQAAFEAIGYQRAVRAVITTSAEAVDYDDVRNSVLCWKSRKHGCEGNVFDPRTGEILQYHMSGQDHALEGYLARYIVALAAVDQRAFETPLPDALLGAIIQRVAAHETGHMLGLKDGKYGTFTYTPAQVRDRAWVTANGFSPSIMNYARFNFLAQPEDGMPVDLLNNKPGPADFFWVRWGYGNDAQDVIEQVWNSSPLHRYRKEDGTLDPYSGLETPGVTDPVAGAQLGMQNLERSMAMLEHHLFREPDPEIAPLLSARRLYDAAMDQWALMHRQVLSLVGGRLLDESERNSSVELDPITGMSAVPGGPPVDPNKQKEAMEFLCSSFFSNTPEFLLDGPIVRAAGFDREDAEALVAKRREAMFMQELASSARLNRMIRSSGEFRSLGDPYGFVNFVRDTKSCVVR